MPVHIRNSQQHLREVTGNRYEDTVTYFCIHGYESHMNTTVTCRANKTWSTLPACVSKLIYIFLS